VAACPECGAPPRRGLTCRQQWEELLALEFSDPRAGPVHFLTVGCYQLQHPRAFPLGQEARSALRDLLEEVVLHGLPVAAARDVMQRRFEGPARVSVSDDDVVQPSGTVWSSTVADVRGPDPDTHVSHVRRWAASVCAEAGGDADGG
jgi:hypothetical protein